MLADTSELTRLALDMQVAPARVMAAIVPVAHTAGSKMKADMRRAAAGHYRLGGLPSAVSYDVDASPSEVSVEVGFERRGQGKLAVIVVEGTSTTPPIMDIDAPLAAEVPNFMRWVAKVGAEAL